MKKEQPGGQGRSRASSVVLRPNEWSLKVASARNGNGNGRSKGKKWTKEEESVLRDYYPTKGSRPIAEMLGRSMSSVQAHAEKLGIPGPARRWSNKEEVFLRHNYRKLTAVEIARRLKRTEQSVRAHLRKLGLTGPGGRDWTEDEIAYLRKHYNTTTSRELAEELGRTIPSVELKAKRLKILRRTVTYPSKAQVQWIEANLGKLSFAEMSRRLGFCVQTIGKIAHKAGYRPRPNNRAWTEAEDDYIRRHYREKTKQEIAQALGRTKPAVATRAEKLGITQEHRQMFRPWTQQEEAKLKRWYGRKSAREIAALLDRTIPSVRGKAAMMGLRADL